MKKVFLSVIGFSIICRMGVYGQFHRDTTYKPQTSLYTPVDDTTDYRPHALKVDEINLVSSYYNQTGNHSPVTGGLGTEAVTDFSNGIELKLGWLGDNMKNKNTITAGLGIDYHTSASAAYVNASGASKTGGTRIYPSLDWTIETKSGSFGIGSYLSTEYNYNSFGADIHFSKKVNHNNGEFGAKFQAYFDDVTLIYPSEFIPTTTTKTSTGTVIVTTASGHTVSSGGGSSKSEVSIPTSPRNTYTGSFSYSQMVSSRLQLMLLLDGVAQDGYLGLPFHRVYFSNQKDTIENLPSTRYKLPLGFRANYFLGDNIILKSYYRYYTDSWGIKSNTANLEVTYKITPFFSLSPFFRYYDQTAARYFAPKYGHSPTDQYYTSNYAYAQFTSNFYGAGIRLAPPKGVLGWQNLHDVEIRYGHYSQSTDLLSDVISMVFSFK
jgi:hypothetical protein